MVIDSAKWSPAFVCFLFVMQKGFLTFVKISLIVDCTVWVLYFALFLKKKVSEEQILLMIIILHVNLVILNVNTFIPHVEKLLLQIDM